MSEFTIYHNPRCSKSRQALQLLQDNGVDPIVRLYLENSPTVAELNEILQKLHLSARDLLRKGEQEYKDLNLQNTSLDENALVVAMVQHPRLIERPIVIRGDKAVLGRPPENVSELF